ncbi:MAG: hypothetical protein KC435_00655 [Thermomicrobiales bacterium]|nr:hypothetical protein [Thermomicrobiales bacterium]
MSVWCNNRLSRRALLSGIATAGVIVTARAQGTTPVPTYDLGNGLQVRDYRLFPTKDVTRFIAEIHNTTESFVDTPAVGVILPHLSADGNYGWGTPLQPVIHPQSSMGIIGVAPTGLMTDSGWGEPTWELCGDVQTKLSDKFDPDVLSLESTLSITSDTAAKVLTTAANLTDTQQRNLTLQGLVRDADGRICGGTLTSILRLEPAATREINTNITARQNYIANPFTLIPSTDGMSVEMLLQPRTAMMNPGCEIVMPWNQ